MTNDKAQITNKSFKSKSKTIFPDLGFPRFIGILVLGFWILTAIAVPAQAADNLVVADPMYIGVGARPLGMGKAYVAVAEDGDAVFMNPAGLGRADCPKITSMYSNLMGDVNYMVIGGVYPQSANSAIGAGAVISSISGIDLRDASGAANGTGNWGNSVFLLSYGVNLEDARLGLGGSFKYFSQGGSGSSSIESASGTGMGFDVGALYSASENLTLGVSAQNPIGTKVLSGNNAENTIPSLIKVGAAYKMKPAESQKLTLAADCDLIKDRSAVMHLGAEYQATPAIALRAGIDQDPAAGGTVSNMTAGLGLRSNGIEFNYAYHPYGAIADNATHYFSVSYVGIPRPLEEASLSIALKEPADKLVVYSDSVKVSGTVKNAATVMVNEMMVPVEKDGSFMATIPISKVGKKTILVEAKSSAGKVATESRRVLRLLNFADVPDGYWAKQPIEGTSTVGLIQGYPDGTFKPERVLTRAELATILVRAKGIEVKGAPQKAFKDVPATHWAAAYISEAVRLGLVKGYPDKKYRPERRISKTEAIIVLVRYDGIPVQGVAMSPYSDVSMKHWAIKHIQAAKDAGFLSYITTGQLGVKSDVTRAEAIEMMSKTSMASKLIKDLFSWDKGYEYERSRPTLKASL